MLKTPNDEIQRERNVKRILSLLLLLCATIVFATWQYRLLCVLLLVMVNKHWLKSSSCMGKWKHAYAMLVGTLVLCIFIAIPNYWQRGRTQLIYLNDAGERISTPLPVYLANAIIPEEEVCNFGIKATALMPPQKKSL